MELWLLRPSKNDHFWRPWHNKSFGYVICAETEKEAREIAQRKGGEEVKNGNPAWIDAHYSSCKVLTTDSRQAGIIIQDHDAAFTPQG